MSTHPISSTSTPSDPAAQIPASPAAASKPAKEKKVKKGGDGGLSAGMNKLELDPKPEYLQHRIEIFDRLKKEYDEKVAG